MLFKSQLDASAIGNLKCGAHVVLQTSDPAGGLAGRKLGLELRDTLLLLSCTGTEFAFLFRKELEGTVAENVLRYGEGGLWIDGCRVRLGAGSMDDTALVGRWPSNLVLIHTSSCRLVGTRAVEAPTINRFVDGMKPFGNGAGHAYQSVGGGIERIAVYECLEGCPVLTLDRQSGLLTSGAVLPHHMKNSSTQPSRGGFEGFDDYPLTGYGDSGGASRFFPQFADTKEFEGWIGRLLGGPEDNQ